MGKKRKSKPAKKLKKKVQTQQVVSVTLEPVLTTVANAALIRMKYNCYYGFTLDYVWEWKTIASLACCCRLLNQHLHGWKEVRINFPDRLDKLNEQLLHRWELTLDWLRAGCHGERAVSAVKWPMYFSTVRGGMIQFSY